MRKLLTPYAFQQKIIDRFDPEDGAGLFMDMGTGKTLTTINLIRNKWARHEMCLRTIVFCPIIVLDNWKREFLMSTQLDEKYIQVVDGGSSKRRVKQIQQAKDKYVLIINYDATRNKEVLEALISWRALVGVCDESHEVKNPTSQRFKNVVKVFQFCRYRFILSGTPMPNSGEDIWSQFYILDKGQSFGEKFFQFKKHYFQNVNAGWQGEGSFPKWQFNKKYEAKFKRLLSAKTVQVKKEECLELPDLVDQVFDIPLSPQQEDHYGRLKRDLITWLDEQEENPLVVRNALTKLLRLNEILCGYMKLEDGSIERFKENPRLDRLVELARMLHPHKMIIFTVFRQTYEDIYKALDKAKIECVEVHGGISATQKIENVDTFNHGTPRGCIANTGSGGVGINMKHAPYTAYYSRNFSYKDFEQSRARNYRAGSIDLFNKITHYHFISRGTTDEYIYESVQNKKQNIESLLDVKSILLDI